MENVRGVLNYKPDDSLAEKWFLQEMNLTTGLFQLIYDGHWCCTFVSSGCCRIFNCTAVDFWEIFQRLSVRTDYHGSEKSMDSMLHEFTISGNDQHFIWTRNVEDGSQQYVKGVMTAAQLENGLVSVLGQMTDVSEEQNMEFVLEHMREIEKQRQRVFQIVSQHTNRMLYAYDLTTRTTRPWDEESQEQDVLAHLYGDSYRGENVGENQGVLPDSVSDVKKFFEDIHSGVPSGELMIHVRLEDGQTKWYQFMYSSLFVAGHPDTALISVEDITERHEQEMTFLRYMHSIETDAKGALLLIESCLSEDKVEKLAGTLLSEEERQIACSHSELMRWLLDEKFRYEDSQGASRHFSRENLLNLYTQGERKIKERWKVFFRDETPHWLESETVLMEDPYNGRVKAFTRVLDITEKQEARLAVLQRADYDTMTGLLRKDAGEEQIRKCLEQERERGGILIILDLDDLKGINDTLGHKQGDIAIVTIADVLKKHFRKDDILVRAGGDEFVIFLPGAGQSVSTLEITLTSLLQKLSQISVGDDKDRTIHCSVGCAAEVSGEDTYDTLFKRADLALYHVKRNGKNNFAFYVPDMEQADYEFRAKKLLSSQNIKKFESRELQYLLDSIMKLYQLVLSENLSENTYYMMEEVENGVFSHIPAFGSLDHFIRLAVRAVHPDDLEVFRAHLSREAMLKAYGQGKEKIRCCFRFYDDNYRWVECNVVFYTNEQGDICNFSMLRWADEQTEDSKSV